ncbi:putative NAD/NADP octopine/nopaline dehydrogenase [Ramaria rubella]|nr:putative NAD/NADP octopine/nopaline dehydrogenase [Ramaria rubella]
MFLLHQTNQKQSSDAITVVFLGVGPGTCACAVSLVQGRKHHVVLWADPAHRTIYNGIKKDGYLISIGEIKACIHLSTCDDLGMAIACTKFIVVTIPAEGHDALLTKLAQHNLTGCVLIFITGVFISPLAKAKLNADYIVETPTLPFAARMQGKKVLVLGSKNRLPIGVLGQGMSSQLRGQIASLFTMPLHWYNDTLEVSLNGVNPVIHTATALMNTSWIEVTKGCFKFYRDGMGSPSVIKMIGKLDAEKLKIGEAYGYQLEPILMTLNKHYGTNFPDFATFAHNSEPHNIMNMAPATMKHRYITQDVKCSLVFLHELGHVAGVETPIIKLFIDLASSINDDNYLKTGRTLEKLGMKGASKQEILQAFGAKHTI